MFTHYMAAKTEQDAERVVRAQGLGMLGDHR